MRAPSANNSQSPPRVFTLAFATRNINLSATIIRIGVTVCCLSLLQACGGSLDNADGVDIRLRALSFDGFIDNDVHLVFDAQLGASGLSCASASCHHPESGDGGRFRVWPGPLELNSEEMLQNYASAAGFIDLEDPTASPLLLEPLTGSFDNVGEHAGGNLFSDTDDPNYLSILSWAEEAAVSAGAVATP